MVHVSMGELVKFKWHDRLRCFQALMKIGLDTK